MAGAGKGTLKSLAEAVFGIELRLAAAWAAKAHWRLFRTQWALTPEPEWFDHSIDLYAQWLRDRNPMWLERGVFGTLALKGGDVLELACGDGFNACDFLLTPLAPRRFLRLRPYGDRGGKAEERSTADIRHAMPKGTFDNIVWDAAIEHFTPDEIASIMRGIKGRLTPDGVLSGYTIVEKAGGKQPHTHEYEFQDMADLHRFWLRTLGR